MEKIIKEYPENVLSINNNKNPFGSNRFGKYIKYKKQSKIIEFWLGIYWDNPEWIPFVAIEYEKFKGKLKGKYYYVEEKQWINLNDELNKKLNSSKENIKDQEE